MILCEREIQDLLRRKLITITDAPPSDSDRWSSTSLDLTLHQVVVEWITPQPKTSGAEAEHVNPNARTFDVLAMMDNRQYATPIPIPAGGYPLRGGGFVLGYTVESISVPHGCRF